MTDLDGKKGNLLDRGSQSLFQMLIVFEFEFKTHDL